MALTTKGVSVKHWNICLISSHLCFACHSTADKTLFTSLKCVILACQKSKLKLVPHEDGELHSIHQTLGLTDAIFTLHQNQIWSGLSRTEGFGVSCHCPAVSLQLLVSLLIFTVFQFQKKHSIFSRMAVVSFVQWMEVATCGPFFFIYLYFMYAHRFNIACTR